MVCWIYRWFIGCCVDSKTSPGPRLGRHLKRCGACHAYYQTHRRVGDLLETQVPEVTQEMGSQFNETILKSLPGNKVTAYPARFLNNQSLKAVAAVLLVAISVMLVSKQMVVRRQARLQERAVAVTAMMTLPEHLVPSELLVAYGSLMQAPLESEMKNLSLDAQNAALFVMNCTPLARVER
jgi:hypothetical protein